MSEIYLGPHTVEAEQRLDSPASVPCFSLHLPEVANRASESQGDMQLHHKEKKERYSYQSSAHVSYQVNNSKSS